MLAVDQITSAKFHDVLEPRVTVECEVVAVARGELGVGLDVLAVVVVEGEDEVVFPLLELEVPVPVEVEDDPNKGRSPVDGNADTPAKMAEPSPVYLSSVMVVLPSSNRMGEELGEGGGTREPGL